MVPNVYLQTPGDPGGPLEVQEVRWELAVGLATVPTGRVRAAGAKQPEPP